VSRPQAQLDLDRLLKLRLVVARFGEMDGARWWNTKQLGKSGATALRRGFPRTFRFAQARGVFAVAAHRCNEVFNPPRSVTLWRLSETIEENFDARWEYWLDQTSAWEPLFQKLEDCLEPDLGAVLRRLELASEHEVATCAALRRSADRQAVQLPGFFSGTDDDVTCLALGFTRGEPGAVAVPYSRREDD
jgi:hypothetical protein